MGGPGPGGPQQHFGGQNWQQAPGGFQQPWQNQPHPQDPSMLLYMFILLFVKVVLLFYLKLFVYL